LASLSDLDIDTGVTSSSSLSNESERKVKVKLNRLCFLADFVKEGFYSKALDHDMNDNGDTTTGNNFDSEVPPSTDELAGELEMTNNASLSQDKLLRRMVKEWNELKVKLEQVL
jgi:hypothetical protein